MSRRVRQKVIAAAAVAVLLAGGALAAVSATGKSNPHASAVARRTARTRQLAIAAGYLGVSRAQLSEELQGGKTLAQIAGASSGKSEQGLVAALEAARSSQLSAAAATLQTRVLREVNRPGGPGGVGGQPLLQVIFVRPRGVGATAAGYLGLSATSLKGQLSSGKTLAQIADATSGKSEAGLITALVGAKLHRRESAVAADRQDEAKLAKRRARVELRMMQLVRRHFAGAGSRS